MNLWLILIPGNVYKILVHDSSGETTSPARPSFERAGCTCKKKTLLQSRLGAWWVNTLKRNAKIERQVGLHIIMRLIAACRSYRIV